MTKMDVDRDSIRIACVGECMIELVNRSSKSTWEPHYGGDTLNTCMYLARLFSEDKDSIYYVTRVGDDPLSKDMAQQWRDEGINCTYVEQISGRTSGLYLITTNLEGERTFFYWRADSPARELFSGSNIPIIDILDQMDVVYFSGITLAILSDHGRNTLLNKMNTLIKNGKDVVFDINYRDKLWRNHSTAREWISQALKHTTLLLPSYDDVRQLFNIVDIDSAIRKLRSLTKADIVLKNGGADIRWVVNDAQGIIHSSPVDKVVDTPACGDGFNAGYLYAQTQNMPPQDCIQFADKVARRIMHFPGAIVPEAQFKDKLSIFRSRIP